MNRHEHILTTIALIRDSFVGAAQVYTRGSCFKFFEILQHHYPDAVPRQDLDGHVYTELDGKVYDITGECLPGIVYELDPEEVKRWTNVRAEVTIK